ncbi:hypothetical protein [Deefgea piscis]|uniref:hypothetical protein n=1 Tax=Deefgea piscis TaxID=2739061 RepID=UPI001C81F53F|nr:hypothetical protein [Deefgea piscis]QZA80194.1 hypothetical protein K4H25_11690 [Deefgea piscis]
MALLSKSDYAKLRGWSRQYVGKLGKENRLVMSGGKVDVDATDALLDKTADPSKQGVKDRWAEQRGDDYSPPAATHQSCHSIVPPEITLEYDFQVARAKRETHMAKIAEMDEQQRMGNLVDVNMVRQAMTDNGAAMRAALERMPDRIAPVLAAETDPTVVYQLLDEEIGRILDELVRTAEQLPTMFAASNKQ